MYLFEDKEEIADV
ncbi:902726fc-5483-451f-92ae-49663498ebf3 [Thermothielavioides terrestris]|uniref:902726fc-5483-451f-92ae-49663498ebf3 n=1 Tax=Thermothielavioides terrestris TaxID=2587410 RepID=A0A3S4F4B6_9PEZI|nr:902726fc-5483-451f-92ae-49663498ebf3 [Thermothielavioides terrestris]